jgi:hypothetical protein
MAAIMCTLKLQKALVKAGQTWTRGNAPAAHGPGRLGNWAATLVDEDRAVVVAVNEQTCLTLVLPLAPVKGLRKRLIATLQQALRRRNVRDGQIAVECEELAKAPFVRLRNVRLAEALEFAAFETAAHGSEGQDDRSIQEMLNTYPHSGIGGEDPNAAVRLLFAAS